MNFCLWITGLPGSGKSSVARELGNLFEQAEISFVILNLDQLRTVLTPKPKYTDEEREVVYRALVLMAQLLMTHSHKSVVIDATGHRRRFRQLARDLIADFAEVYVSCPLETCISREGERKVGWVKEKLYEQAAEGALEGTLPGMSVPYEAPESAEVVVHSDSLSPVESAAIIMDYVTSRWLNTTQVPDITN